jgi:hypothetical protein
MPIEVESIADFSKHSIGKILIASGAILLLVFILFLSHAYQWVSVFSVLLGVILMLVGTALHFESFEWKVPSLEGFGTILIYLSPLFMATALATAMFAVPIGLAVTPYYDSATSEGYYPRLHAIFMLLEQPSAWLATPLMMTGLGFLALGCILKFARDNF